MATRAAAVGAQLRLHAPSHDAATGVSPHARQVQPSQPVPVLTCLCASPACTSSYAELRPARPPTQTPHLKPAARRRCRRVLQERMRLRGCKEEFVPSAELLAEGKVRAAAAG